MDLRIFFLINFFKRQTYFVSCGFLPASKIYPAFFFFGLFIYLFILILDSFAEAIGKKKKIHSNFLIPNNHGFQIRTKIPTIQ